MKYWFTDKNTRPLAIAATVCAVLLVLFCVWFTLMPTINIYPLTAVVVELDHENDMVTCVDGAGNLWQFYGCEDWMVNDIVSLLMNDNGTTNIQDDIIESIKYGGYIGSDSPILLHPLFNALMR